MSDVIKLSDGTTDIDLYYDTDAFVMMQEGNNFGIPEHQRVMHESDFSDGQTIIRNTLGNRMWPMQLAVYGSDNDAVVDNLNALSRFAKQARRYQLDETRSEVYLQVQLDGMTNWTRFSVIDIEYDSAAFFNYFNLGEDKLIFGDGLTLTIITDPIGYGEEVTLKNYLKNPHFEEVNTGIDQGSGAAKHWNDDGSPTLTFDWDIRVCGARSQKVVTDASSNQAIYSDTVSCSSSQDFACYVWVHKASGDDISLYVSGDASGVIDTATYSAAAETKTGANGNTWKRLEVTGTTGASDSTLTVGVQRSLGDATAATTFYVDQSYLQLGASSIPSGWASYYSINNHYQPSSSIIPYLDVCDIPGDEPADCKFVIDETDSNTSIRYLYMMNSAQDNIASMRFFLDSDDAGVPGGTNTVTDSDRSGGSYGNFTTSSTFADVARFAPSDWSDWYLSYVVFAAVNVGSGLEFRIEYPPVGNYPQYNTGETSVAHTNQWELLNLGVINQISANDEFIFAAKGGDVNYDFFYCVSISDGYSIIDWGTYVIGGASSPQAIIDPMENLRYTKTGAGIIQSTSNAHLGDYIQAKPGRFNRIIMIGTGDENVHTPANGNIEVTLTYRPRTELLLGVT
jgi:hypothetical protein